MFRLGVQIGLILSLLLSVATVNLMFLSHKTTHWLLYEADTVTYTVNHAGGYLNLSRMEHRLYPNSQTGWVVYSEPFNDLSVGIIDFGDEEPYRYIQFMDCHFQWNHWGMLPGWDLYIPLWLIALLTALPPVLWFTLRRARIARRQRQHRCVACGYDLQGSGGQCPECGKPQSKSSRKVT